MLKQFHALPTEERAVAMKERDYLWCLVHTLLDEEEGLERLCPTCRSRAEEETCPRCGLPVRHWGEAGSNAAFDGAQFERLKGGSV